MSPSVSYQQCRQSFWSHQKGGDQRAHVGPFPLPPFPPTQCSPIAIGAAAKPNGSVHLILDLSSPRGDSVNDGISQEEFRCSYSKFGDAVKIVLEIGQGAYIGKVDIKHALRICPVMPVQRPLLCFQWSGQYYTDTRLPFGSRSSPFIFNTFAIALAWIIIRFGHLQFFIHYLDNYFLANLRRDHCQSDMRWIFAYLQRLRRPHSRGQARRSHYHNNILRYWDTRLSSNDHSAARGPTITDPKLSSSSG